MAPLCKTHRFLAALFLILAMWANQAASRKLQPTCLCARHEKWMKKFGKVYEDEEEKQRRFDIFKDNVGFIESFNAHGKKPYKLSINKFADLTNEEFRGLRNGYKRTNVSSSIKVTSFIYENTTKLPVSVDWRKKGAVTGIKNQEQCGSCWAFSAVAATEGITKLRTGKLISLSEQELIDCDKKDMGCQGGLMEDAFKFINKNRGITSEANYPYKGSAGLCSRGKENSHIAKITGYGLVPKNNEIALMKAVANQPVSVAIDASGIAFQFYSRGVFSGECSTELDHGVAVVGYGVTRGGSKYWIVKNSWGKEWGESGYIRMKRGVSSKAGLCGIAMDPSFPIA